MFYFITEVAIAKDRSISNVGSSDACGDHSFDTGYSRGNSSIARTVINAVKMQNLVNHLLLCHLVKIGISIVREDTSNDLS